MTLHAPRALHPRVLFTFECLLQAGMEGIATLGIFEHVPAVPMDRAIKVTRFFAVGLNESARMLEYFLCGVLTLQRNCATSGPDVPFPAK